MEDKGTDKTKEKDMTKEIYALQKKLIKELRKTRMVCGFFYVLVIGALVAGFFLYKQVSPMFQNFGKLLPSMEQIMEFDFDMFDEINEVISGTDTSGLSESMENLDGAAEMIEQWTGELEGLYK